MRFVVKIQILKIAAAYKVSPLTIGDLCELHG